MGKYILGGVVIIIIILVILLIVLIEVMYRDNLKWDKQAMEKNKRYKKHGSK